MTTAPPTALHGGEMAGPYIPRCRLPQKGRLLGEVLSAAAAGPERADSWRPTSKEGSKPFLTGWGESHCLPQSDNTEMVKMKSEAGQQMLPPTRKMPTSNPWNL